MPIQNGLHLVGSGGATAHGGPSTVVLSYRKDDHELSRQTWAQLTPKDPTALVQITGHACGQYRDGGDTAVYCVVTFATDAHSSQAASLRLTATSMSTVGNSALTGTPDMRIGQLDGDEVPDVAAQDAPSTNGPRQWKTWLNDHGQLELTGCGSSSAPGTESPSPSSPEQGRCVNG